METLRIIFAVLLCLPLMLLSLRFFLKLVEEVIRDK